MNMAARRGRRILKYRRLSRQVLAVVPVMHRDNDFQVLYWVPALHGRRPVGVKR